ncbi:MAG TPA: AI-2E family transporter [Longimicrobium sp.]|jgi:predicted PurR-regulated permease PerM|uniref:AI-2E family transporter n=1 Tax=Longimicrobium sp. TaxID=2029185 RepID=UPI002ED9E9C7
MAEDESTPPTAPRVEAEEVKAGARSQPLSDRLRPQHLYRAVGLAFLLALLFRFFDEITQVFLLMYAAAIIAIGLNALRRLIPVQRKWLAAGIGLAVVGGFVAAVAFGAPLLLQQMRDMAGQGPAFTEQIKNMEGWLRENTGMNIKFPPPQKMLAGLSPGGSVMGSAASLLEVLFIPLILFFGALFALATPNDRLLTPLLRIVPDDLRTAWYRIFQLLGERLLGWLKGVGIAMMGVGLLSVLAFWLIGVPNALLLGLFSGLTEFLPLVGPWLGGGAAVGVALMDDPTKGMWTAVAALAIQQIEANLITPWAMSRSAEIHPFVTLFALVLFGSVFGFLGILLALPLVMLVWTVVQVLWVERAIETDGERIANVVKE